MNCSPFTWTKAQVQCWLQWVWDHYKIPGECDPGKLDLTGPELCVFTLDELKNRSEHGGLLYEAFTQLDISPWKCKYFRVAKRIKVNIRYKAMG